MSLHDNTTLKEAIDKLLLHDGIMLDTFAQKHNVSQMSLYRFYLLSHIMVYLRLEVEEEHNELQQ